MDRKSFVDQLRYWAGSHYPDLAYSILYIIEDEFSNALTREDRFDAFVGLYGMINIVLGNHPAGEPIHSLISKIDGRMFGQE